MLPAPWDILLTALFAFTGVVCIGHLVRHRSRRDPDVEGLDDAELIDVNHAIMSVAMIAMVWLPQSDWMLWAQVGLFGIAAIALVVAIARAVGVRARVDTASHVVLNVAMMWMLGAMPLLMAGAVDAGGGHGGHAGHGGAGESLAETPTWATVLNLGAAAMSAAVALWWLWRAVSERGHRFHAACHVAMGAGMAAMLVLMD